MQSNKIEWIEKSVFVLDLFHLEKYINHLNYDEYLKGKLQEAIALYCTLRPLVRLKYIIYIINCFYFFTYRIQKETKKLSKYRFKIDMSQED